MYDVIIVGGAAAGLTAALYTSRQGLKTLVITKDIGGQAVLTPHIENYPGFERVSGIELMQLFEEQVRSFGTEFRFEEVIDVKQEENWFKVKTRLGEYECKALILAFGKTPRDLGVSGEEKLVGKGVSYCAICDAPLFKDRVVSVAGWGDQALEAVELLCKFAKKVYLIHRGPELLANESLVTLCKSKGNVEELPKTSVIEIKGESRVESIVVQDETSGEKKELKVDGIFVEMGSVPKTSFLKGFVELNERGEIVVDKNCMTSRQGVFAAGDVTDIPFKQVIISAGEGAKAGLAAYNYIQRIYGKPAIRADWKTIKNEQGKLKRLQKDDESAWQKS